MSQGKREQYKRFSVSVPADLYEQFDSLRESLGLTRSDATRKAIQLFLVEESRLPKYELNQHVLGTITYIEKSHIHAHPPQEGLSHEHNVISEEKIDEDNTDRPLNEANNSSSDASSPSYHSHLHTPRTTRSPYYMSIEQTEFIKANEIQHAFMDVINSTMHIHAGPETCMEIIAVYGVYHRIKALFSELQKLKTIRTIKLEIMDTSGHYLNRTSHVHTH